MPTDAPALSSALMLPAGDNSEAVLGAMIRDQHVARVVACVVVERMLDSLTPDWRDKHGDPSEYVDGFVRAALADFPAGA